MKEIKITEETKLLIQNEDSEERKQAYSRFLSVMAGIIVKYHAEDERGEKNE